MALQAGHLFGNYRIVRLLGEGGFGEVYLAENPLIERRAAVKVLHTVLARDGELVRRFLNEARAASAIRHRNIIEVFDAGLTVEGAPYILMEFLEGASLHKRLADKGRLALPQVLEIARQAGSALAAAHAAGIVHRDLKPENLFLVPDPGAPNGERVKVLDFGIAKVRRDGGTGETVRTQTGVIMGSPAYMSPEQCKDSADVDLRSDVYSFATIIYEALAGRTPYVAESGTEMLIMHLTGTPAPLRELVADVPAHVEAAIMRGLARARDDRFDSMASFIVALRGDAGEGAAALSWPSPSEELPAFRESHVSQAERIFAATRVLRAVGEGGAAAVGDAPLTATRRLPPAGEGAASGAQPTGAARSITTFSRATGEVGAAASDEVLVAATRPRRWPFFAFGVVAVAGLSLFLLVRPRHDLPPRGPTQLFVAVDAGVDAPVVPQGQGPLGHTVVVPDSGAATQLVTGSRTGTKTTRTHHHTTLPTSGGAGGAFGKTKTEFEIGF